MSDWTMPEWMREIFIAVERSVILREIKNHKIKFTAALNPSRSPESLAHEATADAIREEQKDSEVRDA